ncbi:toxin-antitoxin system, toxin component [Streptomyces sp. ALI-76-A]|uniref:toxin-antitoxin system, toxin component n=1 Tax=Streptomyces sp. ALI-76-A TaxID=3025736 RepID=UPI00256F369E|nr:toxin-antitoxin system, toxin component [Streptomyces sp. ALI-76-A]MDL5199608.1 toxin-antitoxin system, toxin component [Streptomyces sp. ALI-76-A]
MSTTTKAMRTLSTRIVRNLRPPSDDEGVIPLIGEALTQTRGRPVRLRQAAFPPVTASGLWVDRTGHDLIVYEENTDPEHQLVIIGHEAWHMFQGHCAPHHGPFASRSAQSESAAALAEIVTALCEEDDADRPLPEHMDAALHFATRTDTREAHEELDAEHFGFRFATDVQTALQEARAPAGPLDLAGRIQASMAHRLSQS